MAIAQQSPIKTYRDLIAQKQPVNFAAAGIGSAAYVETVMLTAALKLPIKILTGYNGNDDMLAMRRGEVVGTISARSTWDPFVRNGYARYIAQIGGDQTDVPQLAAMVDRSRRQGADRADPDAMRRLASHRRPARHSARPARRAAHRVPHGDGGQGVPGQDREARASDRAGLWRHRPARWSRTH